MMGVREQVMERDGNTCVICGSTENLEMGHYISKFNGGHACMDNLQVECHDCNIKNDNNNRTNGKVAGCRGCGKIVFRQGRKLGTIMTMGFFFQCLMCESYRFREKAMNRMIERKDAHYKKCKQVQKVKKGYMRELDYLDWKETVKSWMIV